MGWKLRKIQYQKRLNATEAIAYVQFLNKEGKKRYPGLRATEADEGAIKKVVEQQGDFILCFIPHAFLRGLDPGNQKRYKLIKQFIEQEQDIGSIPPILVEGTSSTHLILFDGHARASASYELGRPIIGYVPEQLLRELPGVKPLGWSVRMLNFLSRH